MPLRAGSLDRQIVIQDNVLSMVDGAVTYTWTPFATVWARKRDTRGSERVSGQTETAFLDTVFTIRYIDNLRPKMRIQEIGTSFFWDIVYIAEINRREVLELSCSRILT